MKSFDVEQPESNWFKNRISNLTTSLGSTGECATNVRIFAEFFLFGSLRLETELLTEFELRISKRTPSNFRLNALTAIIEKTKNSGGMKSMMFSPIEWTLLLFCLSCAYLLEKRKTKRRESYLLANSSSFGFSKISELNLCGS